MACLTPGPGREVLFQLRHLRPQDPLPAFDRRLDGRVERLAQAAALGLKVDKGDGIGHETLRYRIGTVLGRGPRAAPLTKYCRL